MKKPGRKRKTPEGFNAMRMSAEAKAYLPCSEKEIEKMRKLRELGMSYQKIADALCRSKMTVMWHLKEKEWVEERKRKNRENAKDWYDNKDGKVWRHEAYERRKKMYEEGLLR